MKKQLYKSALPKSLSVAFLSASLFSSSILAVHANESVEENAISQEIIENDLISSEEAVVADELVEEEISSESDAANEVAEEITSEEEENLDGVIEDSDEFSSEVISDETFGSEIEITEELPSEESAAFKMTASKMDTAAPELIGAFTNKKNYEAGETVYLTVIASSASAISRIYAQIDQDSTTEPSSFFKTSSSIYTNAEGYYEGILEFNIPVTNTSSLYYLSYIFVADSKSNERYFTDSDNSVLSEVTFTVNPNSSAGPSLSENELLIADKNISNFITLIDIDTQRELVKIEISGDRFEHRLEDYILQYNLQNNVEYEYINKKLVDTHTYSSTHAGVVLFSQTENDYNVFLNNLSEAPVTDNKPFLPEGTIYSNEKTLYSLKAISLIHNGAVLFETVDFGTQSIDESIRQAMQYIDNNKYYYFDTKVHTQRYADYASENYFNGIRKLITVNVKAYPTITTEMLEFDESIPFKTTYTESEELLKGEEKVVKNGQNGTLTSTFKVTYVDGIETNRELVSEVETTKPTNRVITRGVKEVKQEQVKSVVDFKTEKVENADLLLGTEEVSRNGVAGELTTTYEVTYIRGTENNRTKVSEATTKAPINKIIQVGIKEIKQEVVKEVVPFETEYIQNSELLVNESNEITAGVAGKQDVTYEVTYVKGKEISRKVLSNNVTEKPVTRVVEVGSKEIKSESVEKEIPFEIEYVDSEELLVGKENIKQVGQKGIETTEFEVVYVNGEEVSRKELSKEVTTKPVTQIVEKGIREVRAEVKTEVVTFETELVDNPDLLVGETLVSQVGVDGERTITENVYFVRGVEVDREVASDEVPLAPVNEVIQVGIKEVKEVEVNEVVEFDVEYLDNAEWLVDVEEIITPGANGEVLVTYEITYVSGVEVSRTELSRVVLVAPITQVVERGTKQPEKPVETVKENSKEKDQQTLPDTGEEKQYAIFSVAVLSILAGLGLIVPRKKEN